MNTTKNFYQNNLRKVEGIRMEEKEDVIMNAAELAKYLKVSKAWVMSQVKNKLIPHFLLGTSRARFRKSEIDDHFRSNCIRKCDDPSIDLVLPSA